MSGRGRKRMYIALALACVVAALALGAVAVLRSAWFREKVRAAVLARIEAATGGRAEAGAFRFDWKRLRIEVDQFVLHGSEPPGKPPFLRAASIAAGLKVLSWRRYDVELQYLDVKAPQVYLIIYPDGHTNLPEPRVKPQARFPLEGLVNLAIGRFRIDRGIFEVESKSKTPFAASGRNLDAKFRYEPAGRKYRGDLAIQPLELLWNGHSLPVDVTMALALEPNRIAIASSHWALKSSRVALSGALDNLISPRVSLHYEARVSVADLKTGVRPILTLPGIERGTVDAAGDAVYESGNYSVSGTWRTAAVDFRQNPFSVRNLQAGGKLRLNSKALDLTGIHFAGAAAYASSPLPAEGRVASLTVRGNHVDVRGIAIDLLGGAFEGEGALEAGKQFSLRGEIRGLEARRAVAVYNPREPLPWNSLLSGSVAMDGSLERTNDFHVAANLTLGAAPGETPVWGQVSAAYDSRAGTLDLGTSILNLPSSQLVVSGVIGRQVRLHLETRNLSDFLPVLGPANQSLPLKLENGSLLFDGTITGKLENPRIAGRVNLNRFSWSGESADSLQAAVSLSPQGVQLQDAVLARASLRATFDATLGLQNWNTNKLSSITARGTVRNASVAEILSRLGRSTIRATGTLNATARLSGTIGEPQAEGQIEIAKGAFGSEPFDRLSANVSYDTRRLEATSGQVTAGAGQARFEIAFDHAAGSLETGRVRFDVQTNSLPLEQIASLEKAIPGIKGAAQASAKVELDVARGEFRIAALNADVTTRALQWAGLRLGDTTVTAQSEGSVLHARLNAGIANSMLEGTGEWRLEGDYPGTANIRFSRLDLVGLRDWIAPAQTRTASPFQGFAEGEILISGPARKPEMLKSELRLENLQLGSASAAVFTLHNAGPIVATAASSVVTIENARLTGRSTDLTIAGRVLLNQKNPLDLRASGRIDLSLLQVVDAGIASSGAAVFEANVRGALDKPQVNGRVEIQNASLNYAGFPNGISQARGVVVFAGDRATIQSLTGETGGGQIDFTGFAGYTAGRPIFGLRAVAKAVRLRYPEGVSTVANANLDFTGNAQRSTLAGTISVLRSSFNLQSDFSSLLAKSAEPVRTPSANTGFLGGINFDVQIQSAPDVQIQSPLTEGVQAEANLRLRGTASNPALQGRINIFQGQMLFFGTKYAISQGSVSFFNPVKIDPVLDVDLETKVRGIDITLTVAGPLDKLTVTPRSDPPLQFNEIVSVLATGSYANDSTLRVQQSAIPQAAQPSAGSSLLGQALSSPISSRLQRFFGVSGIRIDPTVPIIGYNPQARVTLQQQVTPDVTFTYVANVTQANPQVVSMEWEVSKQWSVVAQREENGLIGLDFFLKKRFK